MFVETIVVVGSSEDSSEDPAAAPPEDPAAPAAPPASAAPPPKLSEGPPGKGYGSLADQTALDYSMESLLVILEIWKKMSK